MERDSDRRLGQRVPGFAPELVTPEGESADGAGECCTGEEEHLADIEETDVETDEVALADGVDDLDGRGEDSAEDQ